MPLEICPWDDYYARMAQTDFLSGRQNVFASKTYFIRDAPFDGSFAILGGLTEFIRNLSTYEFNGEVAAALSDMEYKKDFIDYLRQMKKLRLKVYSNEEGSIFLPNEPVIILEGDLLSLRFAEGIMLKSVNFPSLCITKWQRVAASAYPGRVMEFSRRRAQDSLRNSLYAYLGGCFYSSNAEIRRGFNIPVTGTMGHEFIQGWGDEFRAFDDWLENNPDRPILLIDTVNTLKSGLQNAIKAFKKHLEKIKNAGGYDRMGIRNDSGDLAYFTIEERYRLDNAGLDSVKIFQTGDLDEYSIQNIRQQIFSQCTSGGIDPNTVLSKMVWGCGTKPGTCYDEPSISGVAKLTSIKDESGREKAVIKLSDNPLKTSIPGSNRSVFVWDDGELLCCLIHCRDEDPRESSYAFHPDDEHRFLHLNKNMVFEKRQKLVFDSSTVKNDKLDPVVGGDYNPDLKDIRSEVEKDISRLHWSHRRLAKPHVIKVSLTEKLYFLRKSMIANKRLIER